MSDKLPRGWAPYRFTEVFDIQGGTQPPKSEFVYEPTDGYVRLLQIRDFGEKPVPTYVPETSRLKRCEKSDILIGRYGASVGRICTGMSGAYNVALAKVVVPPSIDSTYGYYILQSPFFQQPLLQIERSAQDGFNKEDLAQIVLPIAPLNEQRRIVSKLAKILAKVNACQKRLQRIPVLLRRFRQSVLAAACSGRLTEDWRESNYDQDEWQIFKLSDLGVVTGGITKNAKRQSLNLQVPYLRVANVYENRLELDEVHEIGLTPRELERAQLKESDILFVEGNGSIDQIGRVALWDGSIKRCAHQNHLIKFRAGQQVVPRYVLFK